MSNFMRRTRAAISKHWLAASLVLSIFIVVGLAQAAASIWYDTNSPMPAWIQAFGSVAAILASLIIIRIDHQEQRREAETAENMEQANLVLATHIFALNVNAIIGEYSRFGGRNSFVKRSLLEHATNRMRRAMEQAATIPHWKMDLKEALTWTLVFRTASKFEAALLLARAENEGHDSPDMIVDGIHEVMHGSLRGMLIAQIACEARYKELTGKDIPQDI